MEYEQAMETMVREFGESVAEEYRDEAEDAVSENWFEMFETEADLIADVRMYIKAAGLIAAEEEE
jgi:hypothetical protein